MSGLHSNQFTLFGHEASDSDDSGYAIDDFDTPTGNHVNHVTPARTPFEQVNEGSWEVVQPTFWHTRQTMGAIVRHVELHHFPRGGAPHDQGKVVKLPGGGKVLKKSRYFLIVGRTRDKLIECPIFTYGEKGLRDRERDTWPEYCSIRSLSVPVGNFVNQSPSNNVLHAVWEKPGFQVKQSAVVRLSELRYRDDDTGVDLVAAVSFGSLQYAQKKLAGLISAAVMTAG